MYTQTSNTIYITSQSVRMYTVNTCTVYVHVDMNIIIDKK